MNNYLEQSRQMRSERLAEEQKKKAREAAERQLLVAIDDLNNKRIREALEVFDGEVLSDGRVIKFQMGHGYLDHQYQLVTTQPAAVRVMAYPSTVIIVAAYGCSGRFTVNSKTADNFEEFMDIVVQRVSEF